jgi:hypothetical protein
MRYRFLAVALMAIVAATGCGPTFDADLMVSIEARWMCDVQRSVFEDAADIESALSERLTGNGVTSEIYHDFKDALIDDLALRERVLAEYETYCGE